jgi:hypothetical protein
MTGRLLSRTAHLDRALSGALTGGFCREGLQRVERFSRCNDVAALRHRFETSD